MKAVFTDFEKIEKQCKEKFCFPNFVMMENAASALENAVFSFIEKNSSVTDKTVLILCGSGNNGADGLALSRRLFGKLNVKVFLFANPKTEECLGQLKMAESLGVEITKENTKKAIELIEQNPSIIVDCIFGTGFRGELKKEVQDVILCANNSKAKKIACDIPSGIDKQGQISSFAFTADLTVTMGALKTALFSDESKDFTGKITVAELGISSCVLEKEGGKADAFILQKEDSVLPIRTKKSSHKGNYGHVCVFAGEKAGAAILAATAALRFGAGYVSLVKTKSCVNAEQFAIPAELMLSYSTENASAILLGSGLGQNSTTEELNSFMQKIISVKNAACVLDADFFYSKNLNEYLETLNSFPNAKVILTPHPKELFYLLKACKILTEKDSLSYVVKNRFFLAKEFSKKFQNLVLIAKGANSYIFYNSNAFICNLGDASLAKAGSGDVLAGMCVSLLAQGYSSIEAAKSAVITHAITGIAEPNYSQSPLLMIENLNKEISHLF